MAAGTVVNGYYDANGKLIASTGYDFYAPLGQVINCDGKVYAAKEITSDCTDNSPILLWRACTGTVQ